MMLGDDQNKKNKGTAHKAITNMEEELVDEDIVLLVRKLKSFLNKRTFGRKGISSNQKGGYMTYFKCKKLLTLEPIVPPQ